MNCWIFTWVVNLFGLSSIIKSTEVCDNSSNVFSMCFFSSKALSISKGPVAKHQIEPETSGDTSKHQERNTFENEARDKIT